MSIALPMPRAELRELLLLSESIRYLAEAKTLDEVKEVRDKAEAMRLYLRQRDMGLEAQNAAAEIKLRAERRAGELLRETPKHPAGRPSENRSHNATNSPPKLSDIGVNKTQSSRWQAIASLPDEVFEQYLEDAKAGGKELTTAGALKLAAQQPAVCPVIACPEDCGGDVTDSLPSLIAANRKYRTIYADPPWRYGNQATRASTDNHYGTMSVDEICAEPVSQLVEDDAHLHLWTTNAFLFDAKRVMEAWGFEYKSCFIWVKPQMGIGNYWRVSHEFMLFGIRGKLPFRARNEMSWASIERGRHSAKPDAIRSKVEKVSPGPYLEMYGRIAIPNSAWTVYGNQVSSRLF